MTLADHKRTMFAATLAGTAALALTSCGASAITRPRVEAALLPTFTELYLQQADILGHTQVTRTSMAATDTCDKGGPRLPDEGVGADWICVIQWTDDQGVRQDGTFELQVRSNSCYTATGPSRITGTVMIPDLHGVDVPNPVFEFDGCFDPDATVPDRTATT